jgi:hypothetical protein
MLAAHARAYEGLGLHEQALGAWLAASRTAAGAGNPFVHARIVRTASAAGQDARARTALDSLRALVAQVEGSPLAEEADRLARAIGAGCFSAPDAGLEPCADPLPFALPGEPGAPHPASQLHYATPGALPVGMAQPDPPH